MQWVMELVRVSAMKLPKMNGLEVLELIGTGECGRVFAAKDNDGRVVAVKVFEGMAINRALLSKMTERLEDGGWPEGVLEVDAADFQGRPACWVMPNFADAEGEGEEVVWKVRALQHKMGEHPGEESWELVKEIGAALAAMHRRRVAHGNLKPGNVFFDENGKVKLGDWTLGNMPGISHSGFTDALLYQSPEQLVEPGGYFEEGGYQWDVFAFGVLAFRLLTGVFPRCDDTFSSVTPEAGETKKEGIHADAALIAKNLLLSSGVVWPSEPANKLEGEYRRWIEKCLLLDVSERPGSMTEVMAGFVSAEAKVMAEEEREGLVVLRQKAESSGRRVTFFAGMAAAACVVLGGLWYLSTRQLANERSERTREKVFLDNRATEAVGNMEVAIAEKTVAEQEMEYEGELGLARLEASRLIGDRLFEWAMERGHRKLPPLDGRELRLKRLERFYEDFLRRTAEVKSLEDERARVRLQLAEISLGDGDGDAAEERLITAIDGWTESNMDGETKLRLGRDALLLALLKMENRSDDAGESFEKAREALLDVPEGEVDGDRLHQLLAILDFHEAKLLAEAGEDGKALTQLMEATKKLNELADARPDVAVLRSELAACYLSSATILEGIGKLGDAREVRTLAAAEMVRLLQDDPENVELRLELAGCYGAMAEASVLAGDVGGAEKVSSEAMGLLDSVLKERPDSKVAATRKAGQLGLLAGLLRDQGKAKEAMKAFEEGISLLERQGGDDKMVDYRLALLWWQKGRMLGFEGNKEDEMAYLSKARLALRDLEATGCDEEPGADELQRSSAYLLGDYAHSLELAGKDKKAKEIYKEAILLWERLVQSRPQSEEYSEGLKWIHQRAQGV